MPPDALTERIPVVRPDPPLPRPAEDPKKRPAQTPGQTALGCAVLLVLVGGGIWLLSGLIGGADEAAAPVAGPGNVAVDPDSLPVVPGGGDVSVLGDRDGPFPDADDPLA